MIKICVSLCFAHPESGPVCLIFFRMAGGSGKNGSTKNKSTSKNKSSSKDIAQKSGVAGGSSMLDPTDQDSSVSKKLDNLLTIVHEMNGQLKDQDARLRKQEEKVSVHELSVVPSAQSSPKQHRVVERDPRPKEVPSFEVLKSDSRIQLEVARRLDEYQNASRVEIGKPTTVLKSGRYRAGVSKVKVHVNWPQDFCSVPGNAKQPTYDELSCEQWVQGFLYCILEEKDENKREHMLYYHTLLMQDAIELNCQTAKRAHAIILQEIEKGKLTWDNLDQIEKIKNRFTQRVVHTSKASTNGGNQACIHYNKGFCKLEGDHISGGVLYQHCCSYCLKETGKKYEHPLVKCLRNKNGQGVKKPEVVNPTAKDQKV